MVQRNDRNTLQPRVRKRSKIPPILVIAVIVLLGVGLYYYLPDYLPTALNKEPDIVADQLSPQKDWPTQDRMQPSEGMPQDQGLFPSAQNENLDDHGETAASATESSQDAFSLDINIHETAADTDLDEQNRQLVETINTFYAHLDQQPYIQQLALPEPSKLYFSKLLQKLADKPPTVIRETDNLYTLLSNTAHLYRILKKKNIGIIKKILVTENNSFEQYANALYRLSAHPKVLEKEYNVTIEPKVITDYAAFFLNTMGGRLYLFRLDSTTRMVVTFYAILAIDRANSAGNSGHGIDIRPAIPALIEEMENGGRLLQFREQYLNVLYDLQEKYN